MPSQPRRLHIEVQENAGVMGVKFMDPILDEQNCRGLSKQILSRAGAAERPRVLLDFANVIFLSSAGLGAVLLLHHKLHSLGGRLSLCNLKPNIVQVLEATGLTEVFDMRQEPPM